MSGAERPSQHGLFKALGPGLLFAATAVGVSHLVQSTRAGAGYGVALLGLILLVNVIKYPAFRFGPQYSAATGHSLLEGYRRQGRWALVVYGVLTVGTMFTVQAVVAVVTAGLVIATTGITTSPIVISGVLVGLCGALLAVGRYQLLDRITKVLVVVLTLSTLVATALVLPRVDWGGPWWLGSADFDPKTIFFIAALVGWMPSAFDVAVWQSLWTLAKRDATGHAPSLREAMTDFHIGYIGTACLAVCFVLLGAGIMHGSGTQFSPNAGQFAGQIIGLYSQTLGQWARPVIGVAATAVMFSTTLAVVDGFPRALSALVERFRGPEQIDEKEAQRGRARTTYWVALAVMFVGSMLVLVFLLKSLKALVDIATTLSFLTAPVLAVLNHRAVLSRDVPEDCRPRRWLVALSWVSIVSLGAFALYYLVLRYG
ncbi:MAG: divalent metal cation transporter [Deltaproteobacteria bacterium]|nr:MAG: divalent metal cation transporter [Deltaproteobacteria bacterium]